MKIEVKGENYNRLMKRRELDVFIDHIEESTPAMAAVQQLLAKQIGVAAVNTEIKKVMTSKGLSVSACRAFVWDEKTVADLSAPVVKEEKSE